MSLVSHDTSPDQESLFSKTEGLGGKQTNKQTEGLAQQSLK